jgi:hypothetical protein
VEAGHLVLADIEASDSMILDTVLLDIAVLGLTLDTALLDIVVLGLTLDTVLLDIAESDSVELDLMSLDTATLGAAGSGLRSYNLSMFHS